MCTYKYPFGNPFPEEGESNRDVIKRIKENVVNKEADFSEFPKEYSSKTKEFIKRMLVKDRMKRPLIKDMIEELESHANEIWKESGKKINFPERS